MQSDRPGHYGERPPSAKRNEREQDHSGDDQHTPLRRSEYDQETQSYPQRRHERENRDYDRPTEPTRFQHDKRDYQRFDPRDQRGFPGPDDFQIKGKAVREHSRSPPRRGYVDYDAPNDRRRHGGNQTRHRDTRYDDRRDNNRYGRGGYNESRDFHHREAYDPTVVQMPQQVADTRNRGDGDVGDQSFPVRYLIVRRLKVGLSEAVFAKGMAKLDASEGSTAGAPPGSLRSVMLVYDHDSGDRKSQGWGFAWYQDMLSAQTALERAKELGDAFTISSQTADVRMGHMGVFPRIDAMNAQPDERYTFTLPETGARHVYRDPRYYVSDFTINASELVHSGTHSADDEHSSTSQGAIKKNKKKRVREADQITGNEKRVQMTPAMSALANRWSAQRKELHGEDDASAEEPEAVKQPSTGVNTVALALPKPKVQTFAHSTTDKHNCLLCARTFTGPDRLRVHLEKSQLHAENMKDESKIQAANKLLESKGIKLEDCIFLEAPASPPSTYVDRAALRREEEARTLPAIEKPKGFSLKNLKKAAESAEIVPQSKGLGMMQRLGYKAGDGLGAEGSTGVTAPITQELFAAGVGLGHERGRVGDAVEEAEKATKGVGPGYLEKVQESARERYEKLNK